MIKAVFLKNTLSIWNCLCLIGGLIIICLFVFLGFADWSIPLRNQLSGICFGAVLFIFSAISGFINYHAYLYIEDGHIKGKYNYFSKIECAVSEVVFVNPQLNTLTILQKNGRCHIIMGIANPWALATEIRRQTFALETESPEVLQSKLLAKQSARKQKILGVICGIFFMFANIFIAVLLTGGRDLHEFSKQDWILFAIMGVIELLSVILTFYFAEQSGKLLLPIEQLKYRLRGACVATQFLPTGNTKRIFTDANYFVRIVVGGFPNDEGVYCCEQKYADNLQFVTVNTSDIYENEDILVEEKDLDFYIDITQHYNRTINSI